MRISELYPSVCKGVNTFICGAEYEIECIGGHGGVGDSVLTKNITKDGSLRNNGYEYITDPCTFEKQLEYFKFLHKNLTFVKHPEGPFSERTSIHVHVNVSDLEEHQCKNFILCYAMLEPYFFSQVAPARKHNIHCVPLTYTALPSKYKNSVGELTKVWSKYAAFNIVPVRAQCTIEFRHHHGTGDFKEFEGWLTSIKKLWDFAYENPQFQLGEFLAKGATAADLFKLIYGKKLPLPLEDFLASTIDVKESFL